MSVRLIDYTGNGNPDEHYAARLLVYTKATRLEQGEALRQKIAEWTWPEIRNQLEYMAKTIPSSWEFIHYTFEVTKHAVSTARQMQRTRVASFAEQSMRVMDKSDFTYEVPKTIADNELMKAEFDLLMSKIRVFYRMAREHDIPQEDARAALPLATHTSQIVCYNLRTLSELLGKRKSIRVQGPYREIVEEMEAAVCAVHPWAILFLRPERTNTPALDKLLEETRNIEAAKELEKLKGSH